MRGAPGEGRFEVRFAATSPNAVVDQRADLVEALEKRTRTRGCRLLRHWAIGRRDVVAILGAPERTPWTSLGLEPSAGYELASFTRG
jgi:hypothetical protein